MRLIICLALAACSVPAKQSDVRVAPTWTPEGQETEGTTTLGTTETDTTPTETSSGTTETSSGTTLPTTTTTTTTSTTTTTPTTTTSTTTTTSGNIGVNEACYPGPNEDYTVCLDTDDIGSTPADYVYPSPPLTPQYEAPLRFLDLNVEDPDEYLAPNFKLSEFAAAWKGQWAVVQVHAIERLQDMRDDIGGIEVNSAYRSPDYNAGVGGVVFSRHQYGDAFDLDPIAVSLTDLESSCYNHDASFVSVYATHVHCDWRDDQLDPAFYGLLRSAQFTVSPELSAEIEWDGDELVTVATGWDCGEPLREWKAFDAEGTALAAAEGERFAPPAGAASVTVAVGRNIEVSLDL